MNSPIKLKILIASTFIFTILGCFLYGEDRSNYEKENLGPNINTSYAETNPVISSDGRTLYFTRKNSDENYGGSNDKDDIWVSTLGRNGRWTKAVNIGPPLNSEGSNFICSVTPDGNALLLANNYYSNGTMTSGVSMSNRTESGWSYPEPLTIRGFNNRSEYASYFLNNDGKTLLLGIEMDDSKGDMDIYVSFMDEEGIWSKPLNLGDSINTQNIEGTPFMAADGVSLYFSSNGHGGYGDRDIFVSRRLDDTWKNWTPPENLGPEVNTNKADIYYKISAAGDYAYFVSRDDSYGESDIFRIKSPAAASPLAAVLISGKVLTTGTKKPVKARIIYKTMPEGKDAGTSRSNPEDGSYMMVLPAGRKYSFKVEALEGEYYNVEDSIDLTEMTEYTELSMDLYLLQEVKRISADSEPANSVVSDLFEGKRILNLAAVRDFTIEARLGGAVYTGITNLSAPDNPFLPRDASIGFAHYSYRKRLNFTNLTINYLFPAGVSAFYELPICLTQLDPVYGNGWFFSPLQLEVLSDMEPFYNTRIASLRIRTKITNRGEYWIIRHPYISTGYLWGRFYRGELEQFEEEIDYYDFNSWGAFMGFDIPIWGPFDLATELSYLFNLEGKKYYTGSEDRIVDIKDSGSISLLALELNLIIEVMNFRSELDDAVE
ncbi:PD40 domain-containing protein [bacterium]|nr:PD40 domain-containing protein [bacterium]